MSVDFRVISLGTLSRNRLWGEGAAVRTAHATTTLVMAGKRRILVDPGLPGQILGARYNERTGGSLADVTDVFCTTLRPAHRRGLEAMPHAKWWCSERELESYAQHLEGLAESAGRLAGDDATALEAERKLIGRFLGAPEKFDELVGLYPLEGPSVGSAGLLLTPPTRTILIAGDAALTIDHVERGQVWEGGVDPEAAMASLQDMLEVADLIVCGHDNVMVAPRAVA
ncbi:MAG: MBL fold metallo-hydrolase [Planctomycetota bacterium]|nr:MBL fold metallo-hydrolase [Planctomycetota bacterium]